MVYMSKFILIYGLLELFGLFPVPTTKARSDKNRDKPYYKEKALEFCTLEQKYLPTDRLLGTTRELALILNM
jgi:hypothetical protein